MRVFLSYPIDEENPAYEQFVHRVNYFLRRQGLLDSCSYSEEKSRPDWRGIVGSKLSGCEGFVLFLGRRLGEVQAEELESFLGTRPNGRLKGRAVAVRLPGSGELPDRFFQLVSGQVKVEELTYGRAEECARDIFWQLSEAGGGGDWLEADGLPIGYPFDYEKAILKEFVDGGGRLVEPRRLEQGCPKKWPKGVGEIEAAQPYLNPVDQDALGEYRDRDKRVALTSAAPGDDGELALLEAGPREWLYLPRGDNLRVGILVSGGIAPGINAVISGIVERHHLYFREQEKRAARDIEARRGYSLEVVLYRDGLTGLLRNDFTTLSYEPAGGGNVNLSFEQVRGLADRGGSLAGTSRCDDMLDHRDRRRQAELLSRVVAILTTHDIHILYIIGGDGSMRAAHAIWTRMLKLPAEKRVSVVAVPKTMDNDILWVWQSFGFLSAVERAKEAIFQLKTEVKSNPRLCVAQLFGSDSGFVVSHAALASGVADAALIPEVNFSMKGLSDYIRNKLRPQLHQHHPTRQGPHGLILLAETAIPQDVEDYIDNSAYPGLGLEEREKEAIRDFVGSSMLKVSDVSDWAALCGSLGPAAAGPMRRVWDLLPLEVRAVIPHACAEGRHADALRSLLVKALNDVLRNPEFYREEFFEGVNAPQARELLPPALRLHAGPDGLSDEELMQLAQRASIPLPHEAKEMQRRLRNGGRLTRNEKARFALRLIETLNRLLLEAALPETALRPGLTHRGERRVHGQTPDELRTGGLKIVSRVLQSDIRNPALMGRDSYWNDYRVFTNEPRHLLRAIRPSASDVIFGHRLGTLAVDNAMAGFTDFMVSQWVTEYVLVPLKLVTLGRKRVPESGIFWRSVLSNTGQPPRM